MDFIKNLPIKQRLFLVSIVPVLAIIIIGSILIYDKYGEYKNYQKLEILMNLNSNISKLVHETQKERGASAGFIGSKGAKFSDILKNQRVLTNEKLEILEKYIESSHVTDILEKSSLVKLDDIFEELKNLEKLREDVDSFRIPLKEAIAYYTNMNKMLLNFTTLAFKQSKDAYITTESMAYYSYLEAKERAGIERAVGSAIFGADKLLPGLQSKFISLIAMQDAFMIEFENIIIPEVLAFKNEVLTGKAINEVNRMRELIITNNGEGNFGIDATYWFKTITEKINLLKKVDDKISEDILKKR